MKKEYFIMEYSDGQTNFISSEHLSICNSDTKVYLSPNFSINFEKACPFTKVEANKLLKEIKKELKQAFGDSASNYQIIKLLK